MPHPTRSKFKKYLLGLLRDFSYVRSQIGIYHQSKGLAMGSPLSGLLANLYVNILESERIDKFLKEGLIVTWIRYADDILCICKKGSVEKIHSSLNSWAKNLQFTVEKMDNEKIVFFDYGIFLKDGKINFKKFRKRGVETVITNYRESISAKKYKCGSILTQLHRQYDCSSSQELFLEGPDELREIC